MAIKDYSDNPDLNTTISGINIAEGCAPSGINNAIRQLMSDVKKEKDAKDAEQAAKDAEQDAATAAAQKSADDAQTAADAAQSTADGKAPKNHASTAATYGIGTSSEYGHVKLSDGLDAALDAASGVALSPAGAKGAIAEQDETVVHKTGAETIAGAKTFTSAPAVSKNSPSLDLVEDTFEIGSAPSTNQHWAVNFQDKNKALHGRLQHYVNTDSQTATTIETRSVDGSKSAIVAAVIKPNGDTYGHAPSTPANSTGTQIVTADWLYNRGYGEKIPVLNTADANKLVTTGVYAVGSLSNGPGSGNWFVVVERTNVALRQIAYAIGVVGTITDGQIYTRNGKDEGGGTFGEWVQMITSKDARLVIPGTVIAFAGNPSSAPSRYLLCNGAAVSRTTYAALFAAVGTTYGTGNGSTTFNLPDMTDKFIQGSGTAGEVKAAGLPDITGHTGYNVGLVEGNTPTSGAFYKSGAALSFAGGSYTANTNVQFSAAKSNAIYGASTTVQPPALTMRYYIKY